MPDKLYHIQTKYSNNYIINETKHNFLLCHQMLGYLINLYRNDNFISDSKVTEILSDQFGANEMILYYAKKFKYLKSNGIFNSDTNFHPKLLIDKDVAQSIINSPIIMLETTKACNLNCTYCSCGSMYVNKAVDSNSSEMKLSTALSLIEYVISAKSMLPENNQCRICFYGGEPLIRFNFIKNVINYIKSIKNNCDIGFDIITNGVLLHKYWDYLVDNDFKVVVSLDGNEQNNEFRRFKNGKSSFKQVFSNLKELQIKFPRFFEKNVQIKSVIHRKNNASEVLMFFKENFNKIPEITSLKSNNVNPKKIKEFSLMHVDYENDLIRFLEDKINTEFFTKSIEYKKVFSCISNYNSYIYSDYLELIEHCEQFPKNPSNTCNPFAKKIFMTSDGKLFPCEKINSKYFLGEVSNDKIAIDTTYIANYYNNVVDKLEKKCCTCARLYNCSQCFFQLDLEAQELECNSLLTHEENCEIIKEYIESAESVGNYYLKRIITNNYTLK